MKIYFYKTKFSFLYTPIDIDYFHAIFTAFLLISYNFHCSLLILRNFNCFSLFLLFFTVFHLIFAASASFGVKCRFVHYLQSCWRPLISRKKNAQYGVEVQGNRRTRPFLDAQNEWSLETRGLFNHFRLQLLTKNLESNFSLSELEDYNKSLRFCRRKTWRNFTTIKI